jgi:hypothetical protein
MNVDHDFIYAVAWDDVAEEFIAEDLVCNAPSTVRDVAQIKA